MKKLFLPLALLISVSSVQTIDGPVMEQKWTPERKESFANRMNEPVTERTQAELRALLVAAITERTVDQAQYHLGGIRSLTTMLKSDPRLATFMKAQKNETERSLAAWGQTFEAIVGQPATYGPEFQQFITDAITARANGFVNVTAGIKTTIATNRNNKGDLIAVMKSFKAFVDSELTRLEQFDRQLSNDLSSQIHESVVVVLQDIQNNIEEFSQHIKQTQDGIDAHIEQKIEALAKIDPALPTTAIRRTVTNAAQQGLKNLTDTAKTLQTDFNNILGALGMNEADLNTEPVVETEQE